MTDDYGMSPLGSSLWYAGLGLMGAFLIYMATFVVYPKEHVRVILPEQGVVGLGHSSERTLLVPVGRSWVWKPVPRESEPIANVLAANRVSLEAEAWFEYQFEKHTDRIPQSIMDDRPAVVILDELLTDPLVAAEVTGVVRDTAGAFWRLLGVSFFVLVVGVPLLIGFVADFDNQMKKRKAQQIRHPAE